MTTVGERVTQWIADAFWTPATMFPENGQRCWTALSDGSIGIHEFYLNYAQLGATWRTVEKYGRNLRVGDDGLQVTHWQPFFVPVGPGSEM